MPTCGKLIAGLACCAGFSAGAFELSQAVRPNAKLANNSALRAIKIGAENKRFSMIAILAIYIETLL